MGEVTIFDPKTGVEHTALGLSGGGLQGAERLSRETVAWSPAIITPDQLINPVKPVADARGRDMAMNDGPVQGVVQTHQNAIVGGHFRLNAQPEHAILRQITGASFDEVWAEEFQKVIEARFELIAESNAHWLDAAGTMTFTSLIRLAVAGFCLTGEVLATAEYLRGGARPLRTAIQMVSPDRLSNPYEQPDTKSLRRGVERDIYGRPLAYHIRRTHPSQQFGDPGDYEWRRVPAEKPWGRKMVIHITEPRLPDQSRGVADMVAVLKRMRMTQRLEEVTLQQAVINATYAASVESELPSEAVASMMGGNNGQENYARAIDTFLGMLGNYVSNAQNMKLDGAQLTHLFPGTKMSIKALGTPGGVGDDYHASLQRHMAAGLGVSYEEFTRDWAGVSYAGGKLSMGQTERFMAARKRMVADKTASQIYELVLEEEIANGNLPLPAGMSPMMQREFFYLPLVKEALALCSWIGAGKSQIDELKETQAAILRIKSGLSTYEVEIAHMGRDYRKVFAQRAREEGLISALDLPFSLDATQEGKRDTQNNLSEEPADGEDSEGRRTKSKAK